MARKPPSNPLIAPVVMTGMGIDFYEDHIVISFEYPEKLDEVEGPKKAAKFIVQNTGVRPLALQFAKVAEGLERQAGKA